MFFFCISDIHPILTLNRSVGRYKHSFVTNDCYCIISVYPKSYIIQCDTVTSSLSDKQSQYSVLWKEPPLLIWLKMTGQRKDAPFG